MKLFVFLVSPLLFLNRSAQAQNTLEDPWPAPPQFHLSYSYTPPQLAVVEQMARDYDMREKSFSNQTNLSISGRFNLLASGEKALELFKTPAAIQGRIVLASSYGQYLGYGTNVLGVVRVGGPATSQPQVFYRSQQAKTDVRDLIFAPNGKSVLIESRAETEDYEMMNWDIGAARFDYLINANVTDEYRSSVGRKVWYEPQWSRGGRYLAYVRSPSYRLIPGPMYFPTLCVFDTKANREYKITRFLPNFPDGFSWNHYGQLILSAGYLEGEVAAPFPVYSIDVQTGAQTKLFDHGRLPEESPDGRTIAFYDWSVTNGVPNKEQGLFLWDKSTQTRRFVAPVLREFIVPQISKSQWSPDSQNLYIVERNTMNRKYMPIYSFYKIGLASQRQKLAEIRPTGWNDKITLKSHGLSPDGSRLYYEWCEIKNELNAVPSERYTLFAIDTKSGEITNIARLNNKGMEFSGWDWHDDSGVNPAFVSAEKFEATLAPIEAK